MNIEKFKYNIYSVRSAKSVSNLVNLALNVNPPIVTNNGKPVAIVMKLSEDLSSVIHTLELSRSNLRSLFTVDVENLKVVIEDNMLTIKKIDEA